MAFTNGGKKRRRAEITVKKSRELWILAFFLSLFSRKIGNGKSKPPVEFGNRSWREVFNVCYRALANGRPLLGLGSWANTLRFTRDQADKMWKAYFGDGAIPRMGWDGEGTPLGKEVMKEIMLMSRAELWALIHSWMDEGEREKYPLDCPEAKLEGDLLEKFRRSVED